MSQQLSHKLYRLLRPALQDAGILDFAKSILPKAIRQGVARRLGLDGFAISEALGRRLPDWAPVCDDWQLTSDLKLGVNLIGDLRSKMGLSQQTRLLREALKATSLPLAYSEALYDNDAEQITGEVPQLSAGSPYAINLACINFKDYYARVSGAPPETFKDRYTIAYWVWELERMPAISPANFDLMHEVWTCSTFSQRSIAAATDKPVNVVPQPIIVRPRAYANRQLFGLPPHRYIVLFMFDPNSSIARKNPFAVIEAFRKAFGKSDADDAPLLVLKTHRSSEVSNPTYLTRLEEELASVGGFLIDDYFKHQMLTDLIAVCDCYISLHRSEGFGLTIAEAMALGKPTIATAYSGNMDFMTPENSYGVKYTMREIIPEDHMYQPRFAQHYLPGNCWAEPSIDHAAELLNNVKYQPELASAIGQRARASITAQFHPDTIGSLILEHINRITQLHDNA